MSLDVYLTVPPTEPETVFSDNVTHNLTAMADAAGIYKALWRPEEIGATKARDVTPWLVAGLARLESRPEKFRALNPENGWGSYEGLVAFVRKYLNACLAYPDADIRVCR